MTCDERIETLLNKAGQTMPDREKVIRGLEYCSEPGLNCIDYCPYGHYDVDDPELGCVNRLALDTLELLKADQAELIRQREHIESLEGLVDQLEGR